MIDVIGTMVSTIIRVVFVILIFTFISLLLVSCTDNFKTIGKFLIADEVSSVAIMVTDSAANEKSNEANPPEETCSDKSSNIEMGTEGNSTEGDNINEVGSNEDNHEEEIIGDDSTADDTEQEKEECGEMNKENNDLAGEDDTGDIDFKDISSFRVEVELLKQVVYIFYKEELIKEMICSGGTGEKQTPVGEFKTTQKGEYFWSDKYNMGAYYWIRFYNEYLFHSVPFDAEGQMIIEENEKLGTPASHGCIRLGLDEAKWMYEMLPPGVEVLIHR